MALQLDPDPDDAYGLVPFPVARWADQVFDWLEEQPVNVRARAHAFTNGVHAVTATIAEEEWLLLWEYEGADVVVRYLGENTLGV